jgi:hypothetical protein
MHGPCCAGGDNRRCLHVHCKSSPSAAGYPCQAAGTVCSRGKSMMGLNATVYRFACVACGSAPGLTRWQGALLQSSSYRRPGGTAARCGLDPRNPPVWLPGRLQVIDIARQVPVHPDRPDLGNVNIRVGLHCGPVVASVVGLLNRRCGWVGAGRGAARRLISGPA